MPPRRPRHNAALLVAAYTDREAAQRAAAAVATANQTVAFVTATDFDGTAFAEYRVMQGMPDFAAETSEELFGPVLSSPIAPADQYVYHTGDLSDALTNYTLRHRRGDALIVAVVWGNIDERDHPLPSYLVVPAPLWAAAVETMADEGAVVTAMECAGCAMPALAPPPPESFLQEPSESPRGAILLMNITQGLRAPMAVLGLESTYGSPFPQEPDTTTTHYALGFSTHSILESFLAAITEPGGVSSSIFRRWSFDLSSTDLDDDSDADDDAVPEDDDLDPWAGAEYFVYIPVTDISGVQAALRQAADRRLALRGAGRSWRTVEEHRGNAMAGGPPYGHAVIPGLGRGTAPVAMAQPSPPADPAPRSPYDAPVIASETEARAVIARSVFAAWAPDAFTPAEALANPQRFLAILERVRQNGEEMVGVSSFSELQNAKAFGQLGVEEALARMDQTHDAAGVVFLGVTVFDLDRPELAGWAALWTASGGRTGEQPEYVWHRCTDEDHTDDSTTGGHHRPTAGPPAGPRRRSPAPRGGPSRSGRR